MFDDKGSEVNEDKENDVDEKESDVRSEVSDGYDIEDKIDAKEAIEELLLPHFTTPTKTYIPVPPMHPVDCLTRIDLSGLHWFIFHSDSRGTWSPGQVLDIARAIEKLHPYLS